MKHFDVIGYHDEDGGSYCTDHAPDDTSRPVFAGDECADEHHCDECIASDVAERNAKRAKSRAVSPLGPRWEDIGSDVNWLEHGGLWARHVSGQEWHVIEFHNDGHSGGGPRYGVTLSEVMLDDPQLDAARESCGYAEDWRDEYGDPFVPQVKVAALHGYGARRELSAFEGNNAHRLLRAARRAS